MVSPCERKCFLDPETNRCTTCNRTREDIAIWASMTEEEQKERMEELQKEYPKSKSRETHND